MKARTAIIVTLLLLGSADLLPEVPRQLLTLALFAYAGVLLAWLFTLGSQSWGGVSMGAWQARSAPVGLAVAVLAMLAVGAGYLLNQRLLGLELPPQATLLTGSSARMLAGLGFVLPAAILEEWVFRGALLAALARLPPWAAVIISSAAFAAYHLSLFQLVPTFILGLLLGTLTMKRRSVWPAAVAHAMFNVFGVLLTAAGLTAGAAG